MAVFRVLSGLLNVFQIGWLYGVDVDKVTEKAGLVVENRELKALNGDYAGEQKHVYAQVDPEGVPEIDPQVDPQVDPVVLDLKHLEQYTSNDKALEQELLGLFKDQAVLQFENIETAIDESDWVMAAHTLKGSARGIGASRVAELSAVLEDVGFDGDAQTRQSITEQLKYAIAVCIVTIEKLQEVPIK